VPLLLLVAGVTCSVALALRWNAEVQERTRTDFDDGVKESTGAIDGEVARSEDALRAFVYASPEVRADEFQRYVDSLELGRSPRLRKSRRRGALSTADAAASHAASPAGRGHGRPASRMTTTGGAPV
jgi:hypothetical protein